MKPQVGPERPRFLRIDGAAVADGTGFAAAPGSVLVELLTATDSLGWHTRVLAVGRTADVLRHEVNGVAGLRVISRPHSVLIPGLVNAHTHLDLTHIGPRPHDPAAGFVPWVHMIRASRRWEGEGIADSVREGIGLSLAGGTVAIGDIAGAPKARATLTPWRTMASEGMRGVSFVEFFSIGKNREGPLDWVSGLVDSAAAELPVRGMGTGLGLQPHASNTVARASFRRAVEMAKAVAPPRGPLLISTHLAETPEEREFIGFARGPQRELLERFGLWDDSILEDMGHGRHPVEHMVEVLAAQPGMLVAHVNDADERAIEILRRTNTRVAYCPRASEYFGVAAHFGPHRYREMLESGVVVALGTDSIVNLPADAADRSVGISVLDEMRVLRRRDGTDAAELLKMGTVNGAVALGLDERGWRFATGGPLAGVAAVEGQNWAEVLASDSRPELLLIDNHSGLTVKAA